MVRWITCEDGKARPIHLAYDINPEARDWRSTPREDGSWVVQKGTRYDQPVMRFEGTPEEIAQEVKALRDTCPFKGSYEAPEKVEDPYVIVHQPWGSWFKSETEGKYVCWLAFAVGPCFDPPRKHDDIAFCVLEWFEKRMTEVEKYPLITELQRQKRQSEPDPPGV